jgi:hypothetical protein
MLFITRERVQQVIDATGEGMIACHRALKATDADVEKAIDYLRRSGTLVAIKAVQPEVMRMRVLRLPFEVMWRERYGFEMKRGEGRASHGLKIDEATGKYISDKAQFAWEIWQEAKK